MSSIDCEKLNTTYKCLGNIKSTNCSDPTAVLTNQLTISQNCVSNINGDSAYLSSNQIYADIKAVKKNNMIIITMKIVVVLVMALLIFILYIYNVPDPSASIPPGCPFSHSIPS